MTMRIFFGFTALQHDELMPRIILKNLTQIVEEIQFMRQNYRGLKLGALLTRIKSMRD